MLRRLPCDDVDLPAYADDQGPQLNLFRSSLEPMRHPLRWGVELVRPAGDGCIERQEAQEP